MNTSLRSFRLGEVVRAGVIIAVAVVLVLVPRVALAHAVLVQSAPTSNATVEGPEVAVSMKFSSRVDGARSTILLSTFDGKAKPVAIERLLGAIQRVAELPLRTPPHFDGARADGAPIGAGLSGAP